MARHKSRDRSQVRNRDLLTVSTLATVKPVRTVATDPSLRVRTIVESTGNGARKGRCRNKVGMWGNLSTDYKTTATIDKSWDNTVSMGANPA